jgi:hypothetical protein
MIDDRNYNVTSAIARTLQDHKPFDTAYSNPRSGKILVRYHDSYDNKDHDFLVEISPVENQEKSFEDTVNKNAYIFNR